MSGNNYAAFTMFYSDNAEYSPSLTQYGWHNWLLSACEPKPKSSACHSTFPLEVGICDMSQGNFGTISNPFWKFPTTSSKPNDWCMPNICSHASDLLEPICSFLALKHGKCESKMSHFVIGKRKFHLFYFIFNSLTFELYFRTIQHSH